MIDFGLDVTPSQGHGTALGKGRSAGYGFGYGPGHNFGNGWGGGFADGYGTEHGFKKAVSGAKPPWRLLTQCGK